MPTPLGVERSTPNGVDEILIEISIKVHPLRGRLGLLLVLKLIRYRLKIQIKVLR